MEFPSPAGLALVDIDGTLTSHRSIWQYLMEQTDTWDVGLRNLGDFQRGQIGYQEFCDRDAAVFEGWNYGELKQIAHGVPKPAGLDELFEGLDRIGCEVVLVSTGLWLVASYFTERYSIADCRVNDLESIQGRCTGRSLITVNEGEKALHSRAMISSRQPDYVVAIGDSAGDVDMFGRAEFSFAVNCLDPRVAAAATHALSADEIGSIPTLVSEGLRLAAPTRKP